MPTLTKNKKIIISLASVFLVLGVVFVLVAPNARAGFLDAISKPGEFILNMIAWGAYYILSFFSKLVTLAAYLLKSAFEIEDLTSFTKVPIVTTGWQITRGLANMFFALILLLMAFDTILQTNKFPIKTILPKLIIVALLINFSLVFCGIIIDFSQILTRYFISAAGGPSGDIGVQLANGLSMAKVFQTPTNLTSDSQLQQAFGGTSASFMSIASSLIFGIIIILIAAFAIGAGAIFMVIRLVSLWVLLIFAPLAWVFMITPLPGLSSIVGDWWKKFFQWTFFAPIYAFFIYLAVLASTTASTFTRANTGSLNDKKVVGEIFTSGFLAGDGIATMLQYLVIVIILLYGLKTAQDSGLKGAERVIGWGKSMRKGAGALAGVGGKFVERWAAKGAEKEGTGGWARFRRGTSYLAPTPWKDAWKKRSAQKEREAMPVAAGARQDLLNRILPGFEKTDYRARAIRQREVDERKDIVSANAEELVAQFMQAEQKGNAPKMGAYTQNLANQNDLNELFKELQKKFKDLDFSMSAEGLINLVDHVLAPKMGQGEASRLGHDLVRIMEGKGQWVGRPFKYEYDPETKTGQYKKIDPGKRSDGTEISVADMARSNATGEWSKMDPQPQIYTTARFSFYKETYNKKTGATESYKLTEDGKRKLSTLDPNNANRWHAQTKLMVMFKNHEDLQKLNGELYKRTLDSMGTTTKNMTSAELKQYIDYQAESVPTVTQEEKDKLMELVDEAGKSLLEEEKKKKEKGGGENK